MQSPVHGHLGSGVRAWGSTGMVLLSKKQEVVALLLMGGEWKCPVNCLKAILSPKITQGSPIFNYSVSVIF